MHETKGSEASVLPCGSTEVTKVRVGADAVPTAVCQACGVLSLISQETHCSFALPFPPVHPRCPPYRRLLLLCQDLGSSMREVKM